MQDCYAGDIGDYGKFALLRELHGQGLCIGVNWYKTDAITSEKQEDGKYCIPDHLSVYDIMKRRTRVTSKSMESPSEVPHVYFLIMTGLNCMMRKTAWMKIGMIRSEIHRPENYLLAVL